MRRGVRRLPEIEGLLTCTGHPQAACMVVVLAVRITFRLDKAARRLGPFCWAQRCFKSREVVRFSGCVVADPSNFKAVLRVNDTGERKWGKDQGKTVKRPVRDGLIDVQVKAQYTPTNLPSSPHVSFLFRQREKG